MTKIHVHNRIIRIVGLVISVCLTSPTRRISDLMSANTSFLRP